jgi:GntR family transcriptional repressor for pyruvate dehydrogenase complex
LATLEHKSIATERAAFPVLERGSLAGRVALILKRYILTEGLAPGHRLPPERRLADWLNVSRTVLREAVIQLIGEGILHRPSPHTLSVADFDRHRVASELSNLGEDDAETRDLVELRVILEIGAISTIVERATEEQVREIERWVVEGERRIAAGEPGHRADAQFHIALLRVLKNGMIDALLPLIEEHIRQRGVFDAHQLTDAGTPADHLSITQHREIFEAVKRRDVETARRLLVFHLTPYLRHK